MLRKLYILMLIIIVIVLSSCGNLLDKKNKIERVGMLIEGTVDGKPWEEKGLKGLQTIQKKYDVVTYYKEGIDTEQKIMDAVDEYARAGVNLIFGHSSIYGKTFVEIAKNYPDVHFVYFNGGYAKDNVTSLNFNAHAMGFFGGMVAGQMSKTNQIGVIAGYNWQPEIEGFYEGAKYQNPAVNVHVNYLNDWNDNEVALQLYEQMKEKNMDVFYPAGDSFSKLVIERASEDGLYAIGFVEDQSAIDPETVLTSTIQDVEKLYDLTAKMLTKGELKGGVLTFDFQDKLISLSKFSPEVPEQFQELVLNEIDSYIETGLLPNQR